MLTNTLMRLAIGLRARPAIGLVSDPLARAGAAKAAPVPLSYRLQSAGLRGLIASLRALPLSLGLRLGAGVGELLYCIDARDRHVALLNLSIAFPEKSLAERRGILRASCRNLGRLAVEFCHLPELSRDTLDRYVHFADRAAWERRLAEADTTGAVIVTAHFGNWELFAYAHGLLGRPVTLIHRPMRNPLVDDIIDAIRTRSGTRAIAKKSAAKEAIRVLRKRGIVVIPSDQNQTYAYGVFVDFFGKKACTTPGAARLAALTGAKVIPAFLVREGESARHRVEILPEIALVDSGDRHADAVTNTQRCSDAVEAMIRRYPEQWIWFHKRWKTRPGDEPAVY